MCTRRRSTKKQTNMFSLSVWLFGLLQFITADVVYFLGGTKNRSTRLVQAKIAT